MLSPFSSLRETQNHKANFFGRLAVRSEFGDALPCRERFLMVGARGDQRLRQDAERAEPGGGFGRA